MEAHSTASRLDYRSRRASRRMAKRRGANARVRVPIPEALRRPDPLSSFSRSRVASVLIVTGLLTGACVLHAVILVSFLAVGEAFGAVAEHVDDSPIEVAIIEPAALPEPAPEPPATPQLERAAEPEAPPEPKPKPKPKPANRKPEPPPPDPIDHPKEPPVPPREPVRRVVGMSYESTTTGGDGPTFKVGNTRMGRTGRVASDPSEVDKLSPTAVGGRAGGTDGTPNRIATRLPIKGVRVTKPKRRTHRKPAYPSIMRGRGLEDNVGLLVNVGTDGKVVSVRLVKPSKYPEFNTAALASAKRDLYLPATRGGEPVEWTLKYTVRFRLN